MQSDFYRLSYLFVTIPQPWEKRQWEKKEEPSYEPRGRQGAEKTVPAGPTDVAADCGDGNCAPVGYDFENEAADADTEEIKKIDKDVEEIEDVEGYLDDDAIEDAETKDPDPNLDYDFSDEEVIDYVINNK